jgi:hypothetical protein
VSVQSTTPPVEYPVQFDVDYPPQLDRLSTAFRVIWVIPILIVLGLLSGGGPWNAGGDDDARYVAIGGGGVLFLPVVVMLLFRRKYPAWWFEWNLQLSRFEARVASYFLLLRDEYPSTDEEQSVRLEIAPPDAPALNRWLPLVKWLLAIPHYIMLVFLVLAVFVVTIIAWFAILFTRVYPPGLFSFVVGVQRWTYRVLAYAFILTTDRYPPFSLR